ncbi:MAG: hypothetical protein QMD66_06720 [Actinomycetota bacterium]|jgi:hypothetical protein|nr:hypothetical protein [Actinomycetota bacterium]NPV54535.1 hypothetical protein [Bacillota bacterium]
MKDPYRELYPLSALISRVEERLELGAERYGDEDYVHKSVLEELEYEVLDCVAYVYLLWLKVQRIKTTAISAGVEEVMK